MAVLGYLPKLKRGLGYLILYQWIKFQCRTLFLSQDIKRDVLLSFYLDS